MEKIRNILNENYDINVLDVEKIKNVYKVRTDDGYKCFKASKYDFKQFNFILNSINHLNERGFEGVLTIYSTRNNKKHIKLDKGYGFMCDWIKSREASFKKPIELKQCVETLSNLHLSSRGFEGDGISSVRGYYGKWIEKFKKRTNELIYFKALITSKDKKSEFDNIFLKYFDIHYRQALKTIRSLEASKYHEIMKEHKLLGEICHHDTANHNFLITEDLRIIMIDFDYCIFDSHLHDLGSIIIRNLKYDNWDSNIFEFILNLYSKGIPVNREELYVVSCLMEFPQDFWQVGLQYYVEKQPWDEELFTRKLTRTVLDSKNRMEFIDKLQSDILEGYYV